MRRWRLATGFVAAIAVLAGVATFATAQAQVRPAALQPVRQDARPSEKSGGKQDEAAQQAEVRVLVIRATNKDAKVDPELREIAGELKKQFKFTGYHVEQTTREKVELKKPLEVKYRDYRTTVTPIDRNDGKVRLEISISRTEGGKQRPLIEDMKLQSEKGKLALFGGFNDGGDTLIFAAGAK